MEQERRRQQAHVQHVVDQERKLVHHVAVQVKGAVHHVVEEEQ